MVEEEIGTVVRVRGKRMTVRLRARQQCSSCGARFVCTAVDEQAREISLPNLIGAQVGEMVAMAVRPKVRLASLFLLFVLPVMLGLVAYFFARLLFGGEKLAVLGTMSGFVLAFLVAYAVNRLLEKRYESPVRVRRLAQ